ncbi:MAG: ATP-binding protein [Desulfobacterales bacterium]|nr:ATP-binding protein [Desulfobacterales bacterium]
MSQINARDLYRICDPSITLNYADPEDRKYYTDFSEVRSGGIIEEIKQEISWSDKPTCQLFTGHIGCGKSTELRRLQSMLETEGFHVIYFESDRDLEIGDVDISDILISIALQVNDDLTKNLAKPEAQRFKPILEGAVKILATEEGVKYESPKIPGAGKVSVDTEKKELTLSSVFGKLTVAAKNSPEVRSRLRQYLEPRTNSILETINQELFEPAVETLKQKGRQGLVIIVDNLDRVESTVKPTGRTQPEYLFADRGNQLKGLNCHILYTIPMILRFSNEYSRLKQRFGYTPRVLPMVPVRHRDGTEHEKGMSMLRQMILKRAFPRDEPEERLLRVEKIFEDRQTLDRLCSVSGGHVRNLLMLLHTAINKQKALPVSAGVLEDVILEQQNDMTLAISDDEWDMLRQVKKDKKVIGDEQYQQMLRSMFVFEYYDNDKKESWFDVNPFIAGAKELCYES